MPIALSPAQAPWTVTNLLRHSSKICTITQLHLPSIVKASHTTSAHTGTSNRTLRTCAVSAKTVFPQQVNLACPCGTIQFQKFCQPAESWPSALRHSRQRSMHSSTACPAYVGEATASAGEYHCNDFDWEEHRQEVLAQLAIRQAAKSVAATATLPAAAVSAEPGHVKGKTHWQPKQHKQHLPRAHDQFIGDFIPSKSNSFSHEDQFDVEGNSSSHAGETEASGPQRQRSLDSSHCPPGMPIQNGQANLASVRPKDKTAGMLQGPSSTAALCASQQAASNSRASQKQANAGVDGANVAKNTLWEDSEADQRPGTQCVKLRGIGVDNGIQIPAVNGSEAGNDVTTEGHEAMHTAGPEKWQYDSRCWESFHARDNATARFYKERRYLLLEFPCLTVQQPPQHFLEIGCGCGSSLLPVLKANPTCTVTGTDLSHTAVHMFQAAACKAGIAQDRITAFAADSTQPEALLTSSAGPGTADAVLLIFTLAALAPAQMPAMLQAAFQTLKPGGLLLIRDHGLYDLTHLRLRPEQQLSERLYRRLDGTMCYFFTTEDLQARTEAAGFATRECMYACVKLLNRRTQLQMKRVFVHGVFAKPV